MKGQSELSLLAIFLNQLEDFSASLGNQEQEIPSEGNACHCLNRCLYPLRSLKIVPYFLIDILHRLVRQR
jgi:hypothetical protein